MSEKGLILVRRLPASQHPASVYVSSLNTDKSRRTMETALNSLTYILTGGRTADMMVVDWSAMRFQHTAALRAQLVSRYAPRQVNKLLSALRQTLKSAWRLGQMTAEDYRRAADVADVPVRTLPAGRAVTEDEFVRLLEACRSDVTAAGVRDEAILTLLWAGGLRRAEVCMLTLADYHRAGRELKVRGKGNVERALPIEADTAAALARWLAVRGDTAGPLFCAVTKAGELKLTGKHLYSEAVFNMLRKRAAQAGVEDLSPHDFRRTLVGDLLDAGADIETVRRLVGHASVNTTARYDRRGEEAKRKAIRLRPIPHRR